MGFSCQLHAESALLPVPTEDDAGCVLEPVPTVWRRQISLAPVVVYAVAGSLYAHHYGLFKSSLSQLQILRALTIY